MNEETKEFPHIYDEFEFVGATDAGFVDYKYSAIVSSTSVNLDDYLNLVLGSSFTCVPFDSAFTAATSSKPFWTEDGVLDRNNVIVTMTVSNDHTLEHISDVTHLDSRLNVNSGLVFGLDFLAAHTDFTAGSQCADQVPFTSPYFTIQDIVKSNSANGNGVTYSLKLAPTTPFTIFKQLIFNMQHDPNVTREVTRRLHANEPLGSDVRNDRRLAITLDKTLVDFNMNYDATKEKAVVSVIELFGASMAGAATCTECYAYATGKLVANIKFCIDIFVSGYSNYAYDTNDYTGTKKISALPDCIAMKTIGSSTSSVPMSEASTTPSNKNIMLGLEAEAYIEGSIGMNFEFSSSGISVAKEMANVNIITDKVLPAVSILVAGFPVSITPTIGLFASSVGAKGKVDGSIKFGAGGSASAKLGGKISFPNFRDPKVDKWNIPTWEAYKTFSMKSRVVPFTMTKIKASANMFMHLQPKMILSIYDAIPVQINPVLKTDIKLTTTSRRRVLEVSSNEPAYSLRRLQTCATGATSYGASASATLSVGVPDVAASAVINGIFGSFSTSPFPSASSNLITPAINGLTTVVVPSTTFLKDEPIVKSFDIVSPGCSTAAGDAAPAALVPPSAAGGGTGSGSSSGGELSGGAVAGIVIAVLFIVGASAGIGYYILVVKAAEASASAAGAKTVVVDNTMTVRSVVSEATANAPSDAPGNPTSDDSTKAI